MTDCNIFAVHHDQVINPFLELLTSSINRRDLELAERTGRGGRRCYAITTYFYSKLTAPPDGPGEKMNNGVNYAKVQRWFKNDKFFDQKGTLVIPIHKGCNHWILCTVDFAAKRIAFYDPLSVVAHSEAAVLKTFLTLRFAQEKQVDEFAAKQEMETWTILPKTPLNAPRQSNHYDCGVFTVMFAYFMLWKGVRNAPAFVDTVQQVIISVCLIITG